MLQILLYKRWVDILLSSMDVLVEMWKVKQIYVIMQQTMIQKEQQVNDTSKLAAKF